MAQYKSKHTVYALSVQFWENAYGKFLQVIVHFIIINRFNFI